MTDKFINLTNEEEKILASYLGEQERKKGHRLNKQERVKHQADARRLIIDLRVRNKAAERQQTEKQIVREEAANKDFKWKPQKRR